MALWGLQKHLCFALVLTVRRCLQCGVVVGLNLMTVLSSLCITAVQPASHLDLHHMADGRTVVARLAGSEGVVSAGGWGGNSLPIPCSFATFKGCTSGACRSETGADQLE